MDHNPTRAVFRRDQDVGILQKTIRIIGMEPLLASLIASFALSLPLSTDRLR